MTGYVPRQGLHVASELASFVESEALPGTGIDQNAFWRGYAEILDELAPVNVALLAERDEIQARIDGWHGPRRGEDFSLDEYKAFLHEIGYLVPEGDEFQIDTADVDPEIATQAGPQLVAPVINARFALNAANARWGSLYDALYGTDAIAVSGDLTLGNQYNERRGAAVVAWAASFLDKAIPLTQGCHSDVAGYSIVSSSGIDGLRVALKDGSLSGLADPSRFVGSSANGGRQVLLFRNNGLHLEIHIDAASPVGRQSAAGISDVVLESALTTIQDCEDSVAAVDANDKVAVYRNWLRLMRGDLAETFTKGGKQHTRILAADRHYTAADGTALTCAGRSVMLVRNVGHLMTTDAVLDGDGNETPEGFLDAMVTSLAAKHDLAKRDGLRNSRTGSVYIVKPKMHGPKEVALTSTLFDRVEDVLGMRRNTLKVGVMDEERRTSVNLRECIRSVRHRLVFINTGFLDRTGDEIHTSMLAGPVLPKGEIKDAIWLAAYEHNNVDQGLRVGLDGRGQIGKGMWAKPDEMDEMLAVKLGHVKSGASTAWVPSPTAAVLHATHYHQVSVARVRDSLRSRQTASLDAILTPPLLHGRHLSNDAVRLELHNNCQSILGYVVRWVDQGIGCSKVPDINNVALMEDRATLRISSQHIANWLQHGFVTEAQVMESMKRMALVVDRQNAGDPDYRPMGPACEGSVAFLAALELVLDGARQPNGYTEPILHRRRRQAKAAQVQFGEATC